MKEISSDRKALYYVGLALTLLGTVSFLSLFFYAAVNIGSFRPFHSGLPSPPPFGWAVGGMLLIIIGRFIMRIGVRGVAGTGLILDPQRAVQDLEPWARAGGGLVKDALEEAGIGGGQMPGMPFDEKLRRLEGLRKDGLITEVEFQKKRQEVLDQRL